MSGGTFKTDLGLLLLRLGSGGFMLTHGWGKLTGFSMIMERGFPDPTGFMGSTIVLSFAVFSEFFCSAAIVLGLGTRFAAVPLVVTMFMAGIVHHMDDPFAKKELALLYLIVFLAFIFTGPGRFSIDRLLKKDD